mgnify:CR=1 FL=1
MQITKLIITKIDTQVSRYDPKKEKWVDLKTPKVKKEIADHQGTEIEVTFKIAKDY